MRKNVASQVVGAQINSKTDGTPVTAGTTTVYVLGDGGVQATGSVGAGACTHEGHGFWTYAPAQAETNYDHVAFTFENSSGVNASVQIYPSFPQTGDNYAQIGAPAGASVSADIAAVKADTAAIKVPTDKLVFTVANQIDANVLDWKSATAPAMTGDAFARLGAPAGASVSADVAAVKVDTAAVKVQTDKLAFTVANQVDSNVIDWKSSAAPAMTGDAFARLGAPAGASVSADVAAVKVDTAAVKVQTDKLTFTVANQVDSNVLDWKSSAAPAMTGDAYARLGAPAGASVSVDVAAVKTDTAAVKVQTDKLAFTVANQVDANIQYVNDAAVTGNGQLGTEWGP